MIFTFTVWQLLGWGVTLGVATFFLGYYAGWIEDWFNERLDAWAEREIDAEVIEPERSEWDALYELIEDPFPDGDGESGG